MNIVFMGTPDFAVPSLKVLIENNYNVVGVVTQTDKPKGRGKILTPPPVKEYALEKNIPVYQPLKAKDPNFINIIKQINPDLIVVVAYGHILPADILNIPKYGCINIHGSLLPKYRGAAPIQWSVINGEKVTGVTSMYMDIGMDTGDIILKSEVEILPDDTAGSMYDKLSIVGADILKETLKLIEKGNLKRIKQNDAEATVAPMLNKDIGNIDWSKSAVSIRNLIKGTYPWPGSYTFYDNSKIKLFSVETIGSNTKAQPGTIVEVTRESFIVQTGDGQVEIKEIQVDSGKRMTVKDYLLGHNIEKNTVLHGDNNGSSIQ